MSKPGRIYAGRSPAERSSARREALVEAGLEIFGTKGYADATIDDLCQTASVGRNAFYESFTGRTALFIEVLDRIILEILTQVDAALLTVPDGDVVGRAARGMSAVTDVLLGDPRKGRVLAREAFVLPADEIASRRRVSELAARLIAEVVRLADDHVVESHDVTMLSIATVGAIREVVVEHLDLDRPADLAQIAAELAYLVLAIFAPSSADLPGGRGPGRHTDERSAAVDEQSR